MARVLVVDDDPLNLAALTRMLVSEGFQVQSAPDGAEAMDLLRQDPEAFDVLLLDRVMPRMGGLELLGRIQGMPELRDLPIILQTALGTTEEILEGIRAGAFYYLTRPLDRRMVVAVVGAACELRARNGRLHHPAEKAAPSLVLLDEGTFRFSTLQECFELAQILAQVCPDPSRAVTGLSELMVNALEHGNLGITYQDKSDLLEGRRWKAEILRRQALPENAEKRVVVRFQRLEGRIRFEIRDEGPGFDWQAYHRPDPARLMDSHGRGILLARLDSFDRVDYQGAGNIVLAEVAAAPAD